ncbi:MAG: shikimate dehydrogenase [Lachnospiraceae bacterium]|nr:shikimate dehydrogenase [Lachnospiraceae bacterium]
MFKRFYPSEMKDSTYSIDFDKLYRDGYRNVLFDIDNTLVKHGAPQTEESLKLLKGLMDKGFGVLFLSNNKEPRVKMFNDPLGAKYIYRAGKPSTKGYLKAVEMLGGTVENTVFVGDQLFTDIWGANKAGMHTILVKPIDKHEEIQIVIKRFFEKPILASYKRYARKKAQFGLIGNPVGHSKSPLIHNTFAELRGDNLEYKLYQLEEDELKGALTRFRKQGVKGLNVTIPYKEKVIPFLCGISDTASKIGAVNTLKLTDKGYFGTNTDIVGIKRTFKVKDISVKGKQGIVLGAGGAAKAAAYALYAEGASKVLVINRTFEKAQALCLSLNQAFETNVFEAMPLTGSPAIEQGSICIQTTSLGLKGEKALITEDSFYERLSAAIETVPMKTTDFLDRCKAAGIKWSNGFSMLLYQAVEAYEIWNKCSLTPDQIETVRRMLENE